MFEGSFKVQLHRKSDDMPGEKIAAQRFKIKSNKNTLLCTLTEKICNGFTELGGTNLRFDLYWKDSEDDFIRITDNDNLILALEEMKEMTFRIYVITNMAYQRKNLDIVNSNVKIPKSDEEVQRKSRVSELSRQNVDIDQTISRGSTISNTHQIFASQATHDWRVVTNLITPGNLRRLGNPNYETLASHLNVLTEYLNGPAKGDNDETKLNSILNMWKSRQTNQVNLAMNFLSTLELSQVTKAGFELNALISQLKQTLFSSAMQQLGFS